MRLRRAGIVLASTQGRSASDAAAMFAVTAAYAREVIHAFNAQGFAALDPKWSGGRPPKFGPQARETIARIAKTAPQQLDLPFTTWSLSKLVEHLRVHERITASTETVRAVLRGAGISWQATKTSERLDRPGVRRQARPAARALRRRRRRSRARRRPGDLRR